VKKHSVRVRILKAYRSDYVNFAPDEIVWVPQKLADELILADADIAPGRTEVGGFAPGLDEK
jgi:hypothetical protein